MVNNQLLGALGLSFAKVYNHPTWKLSAVPRLDGKVALVTGGNVGLGYELARILAQHGARVIITTRTKEKGEDAVARLKKAVGVEHTDIRYLVLDLSNTNEVQKAADNFLKEYPDTKLNILVLNAGTLDASYNVTSQGIESHFAINHLGNFIFTNALVPALAPGARIVITSSFAQIQPKTLPLTLKGINETYKDAAPLVRYGVSKLANVLFGRELQRRLGDGFYVNSCHPGQVESDLLRTMTKSENGGWLNGKITKLVTDAINQKPEVGVLTQLYLATSPEVEEKGIRGQYYVNIARESEDQVNPIVRGEKGEQLQRELWEFSEQLIKDLKTN